MEAELENYKAEMNFLSTQWNRFVREEKTLQERKAEFAEREEKAKQENQTTA